MTELTAFFAAVAAVLGPQIVAILALTAAQVILAVAVAIKQGKFEWQLLAGFFQTIIIPKLLGWLAAAILVRFVLADYLPGDLGAGIANTAFFAVVASFVGAILANLQALDILPVKVEGLLTRVGLPQKPPPK